MVRDVDESKKELVSDFGMLGYDAEKIAIMLDMSVEDVAVLLECQESNMSKWFKRGKTLARYAIDKKVFDLALSGDMIALKEMRRRFREEDYEELINE